MKHQLQEVNFSNRENPKSFFDIVKIEDLFSRKLDHDIGKNHLVKFYIILFMYEGKGVHTIDFTDYEYEKGTVLLIRKDQIHKFSINPDTKGFLLIFTEEFIISHLNRMEALKAMQLFNESLSFPKITFNSLEEFSDFTVLIKHMGSEYQIKDDFSVGITRSVLHIVITKLFRIKAQQGYLIENTKYIAQFLAFQKLLEERCLERKSVSYYAHELGISTKTLNNIVQDVINTSAKAFVDERAIMQIKRLLITTDDSIKEIAYSAGFSDSTNFYKFFKKFTNMSPATFREIHQ